MTTHEKMAADLRQQIADELGRGNFSAALQLCNGMGHKGVDDVAIAECRAHCLAGLERIDDGIAFCRTALKRHRNNLVISDILGQLYLRKGNLAAAAKCYEGATRTQPTFVRGWFMLGAIYGQAGDLAQSMRCSRKVLELESDNADANYNMAQAYMRQHRFRDAAMHYRKVVEHWSDSFDAWNHLGMALHESGQHADAIPCFERALSIRPDSEPTRFMLAAASGSGTPCVAPKKYVTDLFDSYADNFDQQLVKGLQYRTPELLDDLVRRVLGTIEGRQMRVLDFGCGTGLCGPLLRDIASQLIGVDLSPGMLGKARDKQIYDELLEGDLAMVVNSGLAGNCDLIIGADVYPYIGAMDETLQQCHSLLCQGGLLAISVEADESTDSFVLRHSDRYAHCAAYVRNAAMQAGFNERICENAVLRRNRGKPVNGYLFVFGK